jgi:hypothetical protein
MIGAIRGPLEGTPVGRSKRRALHLENKIAAKSAIIEFGAVKISERVVHDPGLSDQVVTQGRSRPVVPSEVWICPIGQRSGPALSFLARAERVIRW